MNIWWIKEPFPKDIEEILISDKYNENEVNYEEDESDHEGDRAMHSEFRRTEGELYQKNICKTYFAISNT